jgi:hypothetical protein
MEIKVSEGRNDRSVTGYEGAAQPTSEVIVNDVPERCGRVLASDQVQGLSDLLLACETEPSHPVSFLRLLAALMRVSAQCRLLKLSQ